MKTFESINQYFDILGFTSSQSTRKDLLKIQNLTCFLILCTDFLSTSLFCYFEAHSFEQYVDSFYAISSSFICISTNGILFSELPQLYRFVKNLERTISKSKSIWKQFVRNLVFKRSFICVRTSSSNFRTNLHETRSKNSKIV